MNAARRHLPLALVLALALGLLASAHAQPTDAEEQIAYILATDVDGLTVDCPTGYPITNLASCFVISGSFDLSATKIDQAVRQYGGDSRWVSPWSRTDDDGVRSRLLEVDTVPLLQVFLTPDYGARDSAYSTVVWVIEQHRFP